MSDTEEKQSREDMIEDEDYGSGSEMEVELEFTEEEKRIAEEIASAKSWLSTLTVNDIINKDLFNPEKVAELKAEFKKNKPFPHLSIRNFVDSDYLTQVLDEIKILDFNEKNNDLYYFSQSNDLKTITTPLISKLREVLYSKEMCKIMAEISDIELFGLDNESKPDLFAAVYNDTNRLLCHDDELEGRRIAYILYLVPEDWTEEDAGHLDLFNRDEVTGLPTSIGKSLLPRWATFSFFEVSEASYHQVREVLSANKNRVSIGGWFHGKPLTRRVQTTEPLYLCAPAAPMSEIPVVRKETDAAEAQEDEDEKVIMSAADIDAEIDFWVNRQYRKPNIIKQAAKHFGENSSIELKDFLRADRYAELLKELADLENNAFDATNTLPAVSTFPKESSGLEFVGPVNLRCYYRGVAGEISKNVDGEATTGPSKSLIVRFNQFMRSPAFYKVMNQFTTCTFKGNHAELRMFRKGCYTLSYDNDPENKMEGLDVFFTVMTPEASLKWTEEVGGSIHYTREAEDEELLSCFPTGNIISLVYRGAPEVAGGPGVLQFTRYLDHKAPGTMYQFYSLFRLSEEEAVEEVKETKKKKKVVKRK